MAAPTSAARFRYAAASLIMLAMPAGLMITAARPLPRDFGRATATPPFPLEARSAAAPDALVFYAPAAGAPRPGISGWTVCVWIAGVLLLSARAAGGWERAQRLKRSADAVGAELEATIRRLMLSLRVTRPVRLCMSATAQVPMAIGWLRPYIFLPVTALMGLTESQIEAILAHELAHIRRHDYLANLFQTTIETLLFYHPAVWWVGKQMRIERENCSDDIAVAACGNAFEYAGALAQMEEIRGRIPEPALAATGGELLARVRRILGRPDRESRSVGAVAAPALALIAAVVAAAILLHASPQDAEPAFEVASIKRDISRQPGPLFNMFPGFTVERATVKALIVMAYRVHDFQISGEPGRINSDRYNIQAKADSAPVFSQEHRMLQLRRLQTLPQDRFNLAAHRETKELPIYELKIAKSGPKLDPPNCIQRVPGDLKNAPGKTMFDYCGSGGWFPGRHEATTESMPGLAGGLSDLLERIVVDKTGIPGAFHIRLTYMPNESTRRLPDIPGAPEPPTDAPDVFAAVQEQLGLKLESSKGPVEVLVIDHIEKPSEN